MRSELKLINFPSSIIRFFCNTLTLPNPTSFYCTRNRDMAESMWSYSGNIINWSSTVKPSFTANFGWREKAALCQGSMFPTVNLFVFFYIIQCIYVLYELKLRSRLLPQPLKIHAQVGNFCQHMLVLCSYSSTVDIKF